jgi:hypothetical protein
MRVNHAGQFRQCAITSDLAEVTFGFEHARGGLALK